MGLFDFLKRKPVSEIKVTADLVTPKEVIKFYHWESKDFQEQEKLEKLYTETKLLAKYAKDKGLSLKVEFTVDRPPDEIVKNLLEIGDTIGVFVAVVWNDRILVVK